jgi:transposase
MEQLKTSRFEPLFEQLTTSLRLSQERLHRLEKENRLLREFRRLELLKKYGAAGEQLSLEQLEFLEFEPGVSQEEVKAESEREQLQLPLKTARKHPGRQQLPAHLPRVEKIIRCTPQQCVCGQCGQETSVIGYEISEQLDVKPAEYFVVVTKREKRACKRCEEQGVECAPVGCGSLRKVWPVTA